MKHLLLYILSFFQSSFAQECNCLKQFESITTSVKNDYVAFDEKVSGKGKAKYNSFVKKLNLKASKAANEYECARVLKEYIFFFTEPHLNLVLKSDSSTTAVFSKIFKTFPARPINEDSLRIKLKEDKHEFLEGIWETVSSSYYRIAVVKNKNKFEGIVLETNSPLWHKGQLKIELYWDNSAKKGTALFYGRDHISERVEFVLSGNVMSFTGYGYFKKVYPDYHEKKTAFKLDRRFEFKQLDSATCYLSLPSFDIRYSDTIKHLFDSVKKIIEQSKFLVIDIRDNGGGYSYVFSPLLPYIYTQPMIKPAFYMKSSINNSNLYEKYVVNRFKDSGSAAMLKKFRKNIGALIKVRDTDTILFNEIKSNPKKIIFLVNGNTASAAEDLLLTAKKSSKTILVGQSSRGAFDHRDLLGPREIESQYYNFFCPTGKNIGGTKIDNIGIKPDVAIEYDIDDWVKYVMMNIINVK